MFDSNAEIVLRLMTADGIKKIPVRFPTDEEYITWRRKKRILQKDLGRRNFEIQRSKPEPCDLALLNAIRKDKDGYAPDEADALALINQLCDCDVPTRPEQEGNAFVVEMKVMRKIATTHTLRIPSMREMMGHHGSSVVHGAYGFQEIRLNPQSAGDLYDTLTIKKDGYSGSVPVVHKAEIINVLMQEVQSAMEDGPDADDDDQD
jgi:hypothetical protein